MTRKRLSPYQRNMRDALRSLDLAYMYADDGAPSTAAHYCRAAADLFDKAFKSRERFIAKMNKEARK